jgi:hypothetical protein
LEADKDIALEASDRVRFCGMLCGWAPAPAETQNEFK